MTSELCWIRPGAYCDQVPHSLVVNCSECPIYQQEKGIAWDYLTPIQQVQLKTTRPDVVRVK